MEAGAAERPHAECAEAPRALLGIQIECVRSLDVEKSSRASIAQTCAVSSCLRTMSFTSKRAAALDWTRKAAFMPENLIIRWVVFSLGGAFCLAVLTLALLVLR